MAQHKLFILLLKMNGHSSEHIKKIDKNKNVYQVKNEKNGILQVK